MELILDQDTVNWIIHDLSKAWRKLHEQLGHKGPWKPCTDPMCRSRLAIIQDLIRQVYPHKEEA